MGKVRIYCFLFLDNDFVQQRLATIPQHIPNIHIFVIWVVLGMIFLGIGSKVLQDAHQVRSILSYLLCV
jgi:hypothetical protein